MSKSRATTAARAAGCSARRSAFASSSSSSSLSSFLHDEASVRLPGKHDVAGLWPAFWLMGNLVRATYVGSSEFIWPWSFATCDRDLQRKQEVSACNYVPHYAMHPETGRGAPEIDIIEARARAWSVASVRRRRRALESLDLER